MDVGVDAEEILRCRGGFGNAEAELRSLRRLQLSSTGPLFFKEALAAHEAERLEQLICTGLEKCRWCA